MLKPHYMTEQGRLANVTADKTNVNWDRERKS